MRKVLLLAVAAAIAVAGIAYAVNTNKYVVHASIKPTKSGTKKTPVTVSQVFAYDIGTFVSGKNAPVPTNVKAYSTTVAGIHEHTDAFPACGTSRLNSSSQGPSTCPKGSKVGSGFAMVYVNRNDKPHTFFY